ncbi:MAG: sigma-70 family RNA polymerase sigma factor [Chlorobi bacterium]|nr:sigma-70 family RNA polymerase sigma factor [Chlorobiota bacterium]
MSDQTKTDSERVSELFKSHADYLFNYAITRVNDQHIAEDLVQDTFVAALRNIKNFESRSKESTWLTAILKNKIIDHYRKKVRQYHKESLDDLRSVEDYFDKNGKWNKTDQPQKWHINYNETIEQKEFYDILNNCLNRLNELQRIAFTMKHFDDIKSEDICKELEITSSNYWVIIHRAKLQLRKCMEAKWVNS